MNRTLLMIAALPVLAGCVQDSASYMIDGDRNHAVTVMRNQKWFWNSAVDVTVVAARQPDCLGGLDIKGVARDAKLVLHRGPEDYYPEPIFILTVENANYAVSTQSCRVQKFAEPPADPGPVIGHYQEEGGKLVYAAAK
jgi:hypothetical protein